MSKIAKRNFVKKNMDKHHRHKAEQSYKIYDRKTGKELCRLWTEEEIITYFALQHKLREEDKEDVL